MNPVTRRDFLATTTAVVALAALNPETLSANSTQEDRMTQAIPSAFAAAHETKPLSFDPAKLDGLSEKLIVSHHDNNYGGSVKALNTLKERLAVFLDDDTTPAFLYNDLKREHLLRTGSVVLHELYFDNLGGTGQPDRGLSKLLSEAFGSTSIWEKEFKRMGAGLGGGSGWVMLGYNLHSGLLENYWQWDHMHAPTATLPILVMDMYEHSYQMDYGAGATKYVDAFFRNIHWETVDKRLHRALAIRRFWMKGGDPDGMSHT
ncbi:MAG: Fe-Mn family superoxide dismutase [Methyloglobulus sp.]|nr:twin-arginine translocation signal domain-containing protein [Methyloglobulus sp.]